MSDGLKLLGVLCDNSSLSSFRGLDESLFVEDEVRAYRFIRTHIRRYGQLPTTETVQDEVGVAIPLAEESAEYYKDRIEDRFMYNSLRAGFSDLRTAMTDRDIPRAIECVRRMKTEAVSASQRNDIMDWRSAADNVLSRYDDVHLASELIGVPSGWPKFDDATGGYQESDLISLVGRPGLGKTQILLRNVKGALSANRSVLLVTMEMSIDQITRRMLGLEAGVNPKYMRFGRLSTHARRMVEAAKSTLIASNNFHMLSGGMNKQTGYVDILVQELQPDIIFIDGMYLMKPESGKGKNRTEQVVEVIDELKAMTLRHKLPYFVTTQFNRQAGTKGKDGSLENIAYSDAISTHSSIVMAIGQSDLPDRTDRRKISIIKGREGEAGSFEINYKFAPVDFEEVQDDEDDNLNTSTSGATDLDWME